MLSFASRCRLGVKASNPIGMVTVAWPLAAFYALVRGEQSVSSFDHIGRCLPDMLYVFLLVMVMFGGKHLGAIMTKSGGK